MRKQAGIAVTIVAGALVLSGCSSAAEPGENGDSSAIPSYFTEPIPILTPNPDDLLDVEEGEWALLDEADEAWNICASIPTLKDPYWIAANYGLVTQAERMGVKLTVLDAGGYDQLPKQISDLEDCVTSGADAILVAAISGEGVESKIAEIVESGTPVFEMANRIASPTVTARSTIDFSTLGTSAAERLIERSNGDPLRVAWFPGPEGASWAVRADIGFTTALEGSNIDVVVTRWGDTARDVQLGLIEDTVQADPDIDWIVGVAAAAEAAYGPLAEAELQDNIKVMSFYQTDAVAEGVAAGTVTASGNDNVVFMTAMSIDQAVRHLQGEDMTGTEVWPKSTEFDVDNPVDLKNNPGFAPEGFQPKFTVG